MSAAAFASDPLTVTSADGASIAAFEVLAPADAPGTASHGRTPLLLVHGATADHTTWRAAGPRFAATRATFAMDRRDRGASGGGPADAAYDIEREYMDVAAVAEGLAARFGVPAIDVVGHSYGGRCALGASLHTAALRRVVVYEGAPASPEMSYRPTGLVEAVRSALARDDGDAALSTFLAGIVGMSDAALEAYRRDPVWPARVAAAPTILREIEAEASPAGSLEALGAASVPVLLIVGSISRSPFRLGTDSLAARLAHAEVVTIHGAAHAAHHTHPDEFVRAVEDFLDAPA